LKHILPRPLPEPVAAPPVSAPPQLPAQPVQHVPATMAVTAPPGPVPSPMQYAIPHGSALAKNDIRSSGVDRRKRKYVTSILVQYGIDKIMYSLYFFSSNAHILPKGP
jgi:mediator of RNA polymerase II transcription subunit 31